jgi:hypothetical protein
MRLSGRGVRPGDAGAKPGDGEANYHWLAGIESRSLDSGFQVFRYFDSCMTEGLV